ncbi:MAG: DUF1772 domain-containing protein [Sandaracinaceae bacterium]
MSAGASLAAVSCGVMAGVYFAFSAFVMRSLDVLPREQGVAAMQSINEVILTSGFMPLFAGTTALAVGLGVFGLASWSEPGSGVMLAAAIVYALGMFLCTAAFNVPLNDALAALDPASADASRLFDHYVDRWTLWNHVRTFASVAASGLFGLAVAMRMAT